MATMKNWHLSPVWRDVWTKSSPIFSTHCLKVPKAVFTLHVIFQISPSSHQKFVLHLCENLLPNHFEISPIWSHCFWLIVDIPLPQLNQFFPHNFAVIYKWVKLYMIGPSLGRFLSSSVLAILIRLELVIFSEREERSFFMHEHLSHSFQDMQVPTNYPQPLHCIAGAESQTDAAIDGQGGGKQPH